jgi:hypothetical protein
MGSGAGGTVNIQAGNLLVDGGSGSLQSWIRSRADAGTGNAGNLKVIADQITLRNGGLISGGSLTTGHGGNIAVTANTIDLFAIVTTDVRDTGIFVNANEMAGGNITSSRASTNYQQGRHY